MSEKINFLDRVREIAYRATLSTSGYPAIERAILQAIREYSSLPVTEEIKRAAGMQGYARTFVSMESAKLKHYLGE